MKKANYKLWLWMLADAGRGADSLILETKIKRSLEYTLPTGIRLEVGSTYKWRVRATDDSRLGACAGGCYSVESTFKVEAGVSDQYYHLLTENSGNYVKTSGRLGLDLPKNIHFMGKNAKVRIVNQNNQTVWEADELISAKRGANYTLDEEGRLTINIARLPEGFYVFELTTENKRAYFFRFQAVKSNEVIRN